MLVGKIRKSKNNKAFISSVYLDQQVQMDYGQFHRINKSLYVKSVEEGKEYNVYRDSKLIEYINGLRWFPSLNGTEDLPGLFSSVPSLRSDPNVILISRDVEHQGKMIKSFSFVSRLHHLKVYQDSLPPSRRCLYEVIRGRYAQKMKFDLDIPLSEEITVPMAEEVKDYLIDSLVKLLPKIKLDRDVIVMTSHSEQKRSYHIVTSSLHCNDNEHAQQIYNACVALMPEWSRVYVDPKVYSSMQQFRLLGSTKLGKNRPKIFNEQWNYRDKVIRHKGSTNGDKELVEMEESLISFTAGTNPIDIPQTIEDISSTMKGIRSSIEGMVDGLKVDITDQDIECAHNLFGYKVLQLTGSSPRQNFPLIPSGTQELPGAVIIPLRRLYPSMCRICNRSHEAENPFLLLVGTDKTMLCKCMRSHQY